MQILLICKGIGRFLYRYWRWIAVLLILRVTWLHGHHTGDTSRDKVWSARWHQHVAEDATQVAESATAARVREQETLAAWSAAADIQHKELTDVQAHRDRLLADLRAGRLLWPGKCPAVLPQAPADTGEPEAGAEGRQPGLAGEELIARLAVADQVATERNQCAALLMAERAGTP